MLKLTPNLAIAVQAPVDAGGSSLATAADVALIVTAVALVALAAMGIRLMIRVNRVLAELQRSARQNFGPVSDRARSISDNLEFITQALRTDVERLNASIRALGERLQQASDRMEDRIEEFNALMEVVQGEAEDIFLDTASAVRGVREGARALAEPPREQETRRIAEGPASYPPGPSSTGERSTDRSASSATGAAEGAGSGETEVSDEPVERANPPAASEKAISQGRD